MKSSFLLRVSAAIIFALDTAAVTSYTPQEHQQQGGFLDFPLKASPATAFLSEGDITRRQVEVPFKSQLTGTFYTIDTLGTTGQTVSFLFWHGLGRDVGEPDVCYSAIPRPLPSVRKLYEEQHARRPQHGCRSLGREWLRELELRV